MEPKNGGLEDDVPFQTGDFQIFSGSMLVFEGVIVVYTRALGHVMVLHEMGLAITQAGFHGMRYILQVG